MTEFAKDLWRRIGPSWHTAMAGLSAGHLADVLKPGLYWPAGLAVFFLINAWEKIAFEQED